MNKEEMMNRMMDYLYDEMNPQEKKEFGNMLSRNPELQKELEELNQARAFLHRIPEYKHSQKPGPFPLFAGVGAKEKKHGTGYITHGMKIVFSAAAAVLILIFGASLAGLEIRSDAEGFAVRFGAAGAQQENAASILPEDDGISEEDLYRFAEEIKAENSVLVASLLNELQNNQRRQLEEAVRVLSTYYEQQRQEDLDSIAEGMSRMQVETAYKFLQTDETIENIIYALNN